MWGIEEEASSGHLRNCRFFLAPWGCSLTYLLSALTHSYSLNNIPCLPLCSRHNNLSHQKSSPHNTCQYVSYWSACTNDLHGCYLVTTGWFWNLCIRSKKQLDVLLQVEKMHFVVYFAGFVGRIFCKPSEENTKPSVEKPSIRPLHVLSVWIAAFLRGLKSLWQRKVFTKSSSSPTQAEF